MLSPSQGFSRLTGPPGCDKMDADFGKEDDEMSETEKNEGLQEQIRRITNMEAVLQEGRRAVAELSEKLEALERTAPGLAALNQYYGSLLWWQDFEADEAGKLPSDLARGVLSEDGAFNLLEDYRNLLERMADLAKRVLPEEG